MSEGKLLIKDSRTQREYEIPIGRNAVPATAFKEIRSPEVDQSRQDKGSVGLKVFDPGLANTATLESDLLFMYVFPHQIYLNPGSQDVPIDLK